MKKYTLIISSEDNTFKQIALISEDKEGISIGDFFKDNWHTTYHVDGIFHERRSVDRQNSFEIKDQPISSIQSFRQIGSSLTPIDSLTKVKTATVKDAKLIEIKSIRKKVLSINYYIVNKSKSDFLISFLKSISLPIDSIYNIELESSVNHFLQIVCSEQNLGEEEENVDRSPTKIDVIKSGKFKNRKIVLFPRNHLRDNEWAVENYPSKKAKIPVYSKACLVHEIFIPDNGCIECMKGNVNSS